jgi:hypothetical protein
VFCWACLPHGWDPSAYTKKGTTCLFSLFQDMVLVLTLVRLECVSALFPVGLLRNFPYYLLLRFGCPQALSNLALTNLLFLGCLEPSLSRGCALTLFLPHPLVGHVCVCGLTHCSDLPSAAVLASRLATRLGLTHIPFLGWSLFCTSRSLCGMTQILLLIGT